MQLQPMGTQDVGQLPGQRHARLGEIDFRCRLSAIDPLNYSPADHLALDGSPCRVPRHGQHPIQDRQATPRDPVEQGAPQLGRECSALDQFSRTVRYWVSHR